MTQSAVLQLPPFRDAARSFLLHLDVCLCALKVQQTLFLFAKQKQYLHLKKLSLHSWLQSLLSICLSENLYSLYFLYDSARFTSLHPHTMFSVLLPAVKNSKLKDSDTFSTLSRSRCAGNLFWKNHSYFLKWHWRKCLLMNRFSFFFLNVGMFSQVTSPSIRERETRRSRLQTRVFVRGVESGCNSRGNKGIEQRACLQRARDPAEDEYLSRMCCMRPEKLQRWCTISEFWPLCVFYFPFLRKIVQFGDVWKLGSRDRSLALFSSRHEKAPKYWQITVKRGRKQIVL